MSLKVRLGNFRSRRIPAKNLIVWENLDNYRDFGVGTIHGAYVQTHRCARVRHRLCVVVVVGTSVKRRKKSKKKIVRKRKGSEVAWKKRQIAKIPQCASSLQTSEAHNRKQLTLRLFPLQKVLIKFQYT